MHRTLDFIGRVRAVKYVDLPRKIEKINEPLQARKSKIRSTRANKTLYIIIVVTVCLQKDHNVYFNLRAYLYGRERFLKDANYSTVFDI